MNWVEGDGEERNLQGVSEKCKYGINLTGPSAHIKQTDISKATKNQKGKNSLVSYSCSSDVLLSLNASKNSAKDRKHAGLSERIGIQTSHTHLPNHPNSILIDAILSTPCNRRFHDTTSRSYISSNIFLVLSIRAIRIKFSSFYAILRSK